MNDCVSFMIITAVIYDYVLTFSRETMFGIDPGPGYPQYLFWSAILASLGLFLVAFMVAPLCLVQ